MRAARSQRTLFSFTVVLDATSAPKPGRCPQIAGSPALQDIAARNSLAGANAEQAQERHRQVLKLRVFGANAPADEQHAWNISRVNTMITHPRVRVVFDEGGWYPAQ